MKRRQHDQVQTGTVPRETLRSDDGIIEFRLTAVTGGVYVERLKHKPGRGRILQATVFEDDAKFQQWCDADALRYTYPRIYIALSRTGNNILTRGA